jgi:hypothetical protein
MNHPQELAMLAQVAAGNQVLPLTQGQAMHRAFNAETADNSRPGTYAGVALATLFALERAGWKALPCEPSREVAVHFVRPWAKKVEGVDSPPDSTHSVAQTGERQVKDAWHSAREVSHLWAGTMLIYGTHLRQRLFPVMEDVLFTRLGMRKVLGVARTVQDWALTWQAPRSRERTQLLGPHPWLVPDDVPMLDIPWPDRPSPLLLEALETYSRRPR